MIWHFRHKPTIVGGCIRVASREAVESAPWSYTRFRNEGGSSR